MSAITQPTSVPARDALRPIIKSQLHAALAMLKQAVERCPEDLWVDRSHPNAFWHVAYHALFFAHLNLHKDREAFRPWEKHRDEYHFLGQTPFPPHRPPRIGEPYTRAEVLEYAALCDASIDPAIDAMDLDAAECGFPWYSMSKLEHQFVAIRHVQHHTAQLCDRLREKAAVGCDWVGAGPSH